MIVCSCHAVSERSIRDAAARGMGHAEVMALTRAGTDCGHCRESVEEIVSSSGRGPCRGDHACPGCPQRSAT
jgi:bacterioferritin-associated ferredoxin